MIDYSTTGCSICPNRTSLPPNLYQPPICDSHELNPGEREKLEWFIWWTTNNDHSVINRIFMDMNRTKYWNLADLLLKICDKQRPRALEIVKEIMDQPSDFMVCMITLDRCKNQLPRLLGYSGSKKLIYERFGQHRAWWKEQLCCVSKPNVNCRALKEQQTLCQEGRANTNSKPQYRCDQCSTWYSDSQDCAEYEYDDNKYSSIVLKKNNQGEVLRKCIGCKKIETRIMQLLEFEAQGDPSVFDPDVFDLLSDNLLSNSDNVEFETKESKKIETKESKGIETKDSKESDCKVYFLEITKNLKQRPLIKDDIPRTLLLGGKAETIVPRVLPKKSWAPVASSSSF